MKRGALFLDRDGTIIEHVHYLHDPAQVTLAPGARDALAEARARGLLLFILTNQSGVGRGMFTIAEVDACNARMLEHLDLGPDLFTEICAATEAPGEPSRYRKPKPDFVLEMIARHDLDPARCLMIGDMPTDWQTGLNAGITPLAMYSALTDAQTREERERLQIPQITNLRQSLDHPAMVSTDP